MNAEAFFDSNIAVYAFGDEGHRTEVAEQLMRSGGCISVQVLNEFAYVARRKLKMQWYEVRLALVAIRKMCSEPSPITSELHDIAVGIAERYGYRIYDALIIASAAEAGCRRLYSEDMANGQTIEGVRIVNPFV
jgi:predicted nucleic acid-binding protein